MKLPPPEPSAEDSWIEEWMDNSDEEIIAAAQKALLAKRVRLAGRLSSLLQEENIAPYPDLQRARRAAYMLVHKGGLGTQTQPDDLQALRRRRRQRMTRSKSRQRRSVNPKDPRFRRK